MNLWGLSMLQLPVQLQHFKAYVFALVLIAAKPHGLHHRLTLQLCAMGWHVWVWSDSVVNSRGVHMVQSHLYAPCQGGSKSLLKCKWQVSHGCQDGTRDIECWAVTPRCLLVPFIFVLSKTKKSLDQKVFYSTKHHRGPVAWLMLMCPLPDSATVPRITVWPASSRSFLVSRTARLMEGVANVKLSVSWYPMRRGLELAYTWGGRKGVICGVRNQRKAFKTGRNSHF